MIQCSILKLFSRENTGAQVMQLLYQLREDSLLTQLALAMPSGIDVDLGYGDEKGGNEEGGKKREEGGERREGRRERKEGLVGRQDLDNVRAMYIQSQLGKFHAGLSQFLHYI